MRLYYKLLLILLPLIILPALLAGIITYQLSRTALQQTTREILKIKLADAISVSVENNDVLHQFGLDNIPSNVEKARAETVEALNAIRFGETGHIFVVDSQGIVQSHPDPDLVGSNVSNQSWFSQILNQEEGSLIEFAWQNENYLVTAGYFEPWDWHIVAGRAQTETLGATGQVAAYTFWGVIAVLLIAAPVLLVAIRRFTLPIQILATTAKSVGRGDFDVHIDVQSGDEIGQLGEAFNTMSGQIETLVSTLEDQVAARTRRLEVAAALSERLSAILNLEDLLNGTVNKIQENFGYYHAHIYLLDDEQSNLIVAAGTGEAGVVMKAKGHSIALNAPTSLVARAARTGQIVRVDNAREAEDWLPNPLLPDTYSEMAVPIVVNEQVVGVLDVQEDRIAGLDEGDVGLLRSLANQVAVAIRNARLFEEVETALAETRAAQKRYVEQVWDRTKVTRQNVGRVLFSLGKTAPLTDVAIAEARRHAFAKKEPALVVLNGDKQESQRITDTKEQGSDATLTGAGEQGSNTADSIENPKPKIQNQTALVAPITLQNATVGNLQLHEVDPDRQWTESELALIEAVVDQVAQVAENLRLLNDTQERASRERLIGQVSDKLRRAPDLETLMKVGVEELSRALGPARTFVRLGSEAELGSGQADAPESIVEEISEQPQLNNGSLKEEQDTHSAASRKLTMSN